MLTVDDLTCAVDTTGSVLHCCADQDFVQGIAVYGCCPGYCVTDMTSGRGNNTAAQGADTPVWLALQPIGSIPNGELFGEREVVPW